MTISFFLKNLKKIEILRQFYVVCERNGSASETRRLINEYKNGCQKATVRTLILMLSFQVMG